MKSSQQLLTREVKDRLDEYPEQGGLEINFCSEFKFVEKTAALHKALQECRDVIFPESVNAGLAKASYWIFQHLYLKLRVSLAVHCLLEVRFGCPCYY